MICLVNDSDSRNVWLVRAVLALCKLLATYSCFTCIGKFPEHSKTFCILCMCKPVTSILKWKRHADHQKGVSQTKLNVNYFRFLTTTISGFSGPKIRHGDSTHPGAHHGQLPTGSECWPCAIVCSAGAEVGSIRASHDYQECRQGDWDFWAELCPSGSMSSIEMDPNLLLRLHSIA